MLKLPSAPPEQKRRMCRDGCPRDTLSLAGWRCYRPITPISPQFYCTACFNYIFWFSSDLVYPEESV